jgi:hypothetical protein
VLTPPELPLPPSPRSRGTARPVVVPPPRLWSPYSGFTGACRGASFPPLPPHAEPPPDDDELPDVEVALEPLELDDEEPEDEPESRETADPVVGASAGRERSCAHRGATLSAKVAAVRPIVNL